MNEANIATSHHPNRPFQMLKCSRKENSGSKDQEIYTKSFGAGEKLELWFIGPRDLKLERNLSL